MDDSILLTTKSMLMVPIDCNEFNTDIITYINSAFSVLTQLGVGPVSGFSIADETACWRDFIDDYSRLGMIKSYILLKVKLQFDPPSNASVLNAYKQEIAECEWRLNVAVETPGGENT